MSAMESSPLPTLVIVGRPNVGKSTLFNRILGEQQAIVEDRPGVTRDRKELEAEWLGVPFRVIDTGGWMPRGSDLDDKVSRQVEAAVQEADLVVFVVDASVGILEEDEAVANWLRRGDHEVLVVANKIPRLATGKPKRIGFTTKLCLVPPARLQSAAGDSPVPERPPPARDRVGLAKLAKFAKIKNFAKI